MIKSSEQFVKKKIRYAQFESENANTKVCNVIFLGTLFEMQVFDCGNYNNFRVNYDVIKYINEQGNEKKKTEINHWEQFD